MDPPTKSDLPANESGSSTRPIRHYESEQMKAYLKKINDIWTFHSLEEDCCNFKKWKKFFQGLPSANFKQWDNFLNRYSDLKKLVESLNDEEDDSFEDEYSKIQKQLQHERGKAQTEANKLLTKLNAVVKEGGKRFCGLETSPLNLETREVSKDRSKYHYQPNVQENLLKVFPDLLKKDYCCPEPVITNKKNINRSKNRDVKEDKDDEAKAVIRVVRMFQELSLEGRTPSPMFILTNYQFPNILKYVKDVKVSSQSGEFDIIVLSKEYSCFFIGEIKACNRDASNLTKHIFEAKDQLFKYYAIIQETFRDRPDILELPVYDFIGTPFVHRGKLQDKMSKKIDDKKVLTEDDLQDQKAFTDWFSRTFSQVSGVGQHSSMDDDQYCTVVERFAGFGSEVEKTSPQMRTREEGKRLFLGKKLTCVQEELVNSNHHLLAIAGDYGTGKSFTLVRRAIRFIECAQSSDRCIKVVMVSCADVAISGKYVDKCSPEHMVHHLQHLLQKHHKNIQVKTFSSFVGKCNSENSQEESLESQEACLKVLTDAVETELNAGNMSLHLLFDEVPLNLVSQQYFKDFFKWLNEKKERVSVSMTIATHSYRVFNKDKSWVREVLPEDCMYRYLDKVQRTPQRVFNLQKEISSYCGDDHQSELDDNLWGGSMPLLYRVPDCSCLTENQPEPLSTPCVEGRLKCTLKQLFQDLHIIDENGVVKKEKKDRPGKVVIIISAVTCPNLESQICGLLEQCFQQLDIRIKNELSVDTSNSNGDNPSQDDGQKSPSVGDEILLTKETYYIGCERNVVICIDLNAMKHWFNGSRIAYSALAVSRSLSDYVHLTFPEEEASKMFKTNLNANEGLMSSEEINEAFCKSQEGKGCLQTVLDKQVIQEKKVNKLAEICNNKQ